MLSIGKIALGQQRYYEQQVAQGGDDYYSGRGEAPGEWVGAGAQELGLSGGVSREQFSALIAGLDPRDREVRLRASSRDPKVAAFDLTFSAPKSLSVLFAVAPEAVSGELVACHEEAVRAALGYLEDTAVMVRRGHAGERVEPAAGLVAAAYRHRMSRALDPQLHTHVVAANLARGSDGRHTALHGTALYRAAKTAGFLYQAHLRVLVAERLGLKWGEVRKGAAELDGVTQPVLAEFSTRRREMERMARDGGIRLGSKAAGESAALSTRDRKQYGVDTHTWREEVRARAGELGLGTGEVADLLRAAHERAIHGVGVQSAHDERRLGDRLAGADGLTARDNTFDLGSVIREFAQDARQGIRVQDVRGQAARFAQRGDVLKTDREEMTTADLIASERGLVASATGRAGEGTAIVDPVLVERAIAAAPRPLTEEQAIAVRATLSAGDGVSVIQALAGTGKTYIAGVLRQGYESAGHEVLGVAPTGRAVRELAEEAGIPARTLDRLLLDIEQRGEQLPTGAVLIFDEAGMAATRPSSRLLQEAERAGVKVIAIGDPGQLASVQAGGWLAALARQLGAPRLTVVVRQRDRGERRALGALHDGLPDRYLQWAEHAGHIQTFDDPADACEQAIEGWALAAAEAEPGRVVMIARDNETREELNRGARALVKLRGGLAETCFYGTVELAVGDRVICRRNDHRIDVDNGTRGTVRNLDGHRVLIDTDAGPVRELPARYVADHVQHAYALTGHGMQGGTVETAIVVASPRDLTAGWSYTALSRARGDTRLLIHNSEPAQERSEFAPAGEAHRAPRAELLARVRTRMQERDDEDLAIDQLATPGRGDAPEREGDRAPSAEPQRERAAERVGTSTAGTATHARFLELRQQGERLEAQLAALPTRKLQQIDDLDARATRLSTQREELTGRLAEIPEPRRRLGLTHDPHAVDRHHLTSALKATERELDSVRLRGARLGHQPGDVERLRDERDALERALVHATHMMTAARDELVEREISAPSQWVRDTFGDRPDGPRASRTWENTVRQVARYRIQQDITDTDDALGPEPTQRAERREWAKAHEAIEQARRYPGRCAPAERHAEIDIGM